MKIHLFVLVLLFPVLPAVAQSIRYSDEQWEGMKQLNPGKKISVNVALAGDINGKFVRVENQDLYIEKRGEEMRLKRENIRFVFAGHKRNLAPSLVGAAVGFAVGAAFGNYMISALSEGYDTLGDHVKGTIAFGGLGAGCGWIAGSTLDSSPRTQLLYRAD